MSTRRRCAPSLPSLRRRLELGFALGGRPGPRNSSTSSSDQRQNARQIASADACIHASTAGESPVRRRSSLAPRREAAVRTRTRVDSLSARLVTERAHLSDRRRRGTDDHRVARVARRLRRRAARSTTGTQAIQAPRGLRFRRRFWGCAIGRLRRPTRQVDCRGRVPTPRVGASVGPVSRRLECLSLSSRPAPSPDSAA